MPSAPDPKPPPTDKKDKVIHTRVPDHLDEELKAKAANLGISVSNLVRNILNNTVDLIEDVIVDGSRIGRAAAGESAPPAAPPAQDEPAAPGPILGWQRLTLNLNAVCADCNAILAKGTEAALGLRATAAAPPTLICLTCLEENHA